VKLRLRTKPAAKTAGIFSKVSLRLYPHKKWLVNILYSIDADNRPSDFKVEQQINKY